MKSWKSVLCMALCLILAVSSCMMFTSCNKEKLPAFDNAERSEHMKQEKDKPFQVLFSGLDRSDSTHPVCIAMDRFEKEYDKPIDFVTCGYDEWNQKVLASLASGSPIDVVNAGNYEFPLYAMKRYAQPIDGLVDLSADCVDGPVVDVFKYMGKHYVAASTGSSIPLMIYYNKNMFENEGIEDPLELYHENKWTTDKLKEVAMKFTKDTNGDGSLDQWGMTAWYTWVFFGSSAASVCKINDEGKFELNMENNPNLQEALELIRSAWYTDKWVGTAGGDIYTSFYQQKNAMLNEFTWAGKTILKAKDEGQFAFDVGVAPFPYGKTNPDRLNYCFMNGEAILNGCACPYSGGALIDLILEEYAKDYNKTLDSIPKEWVDLYEDLRSRPFNSSMPDNAVDSGKALCGMVSSGMDIQQAIESYVPVYQALLDEANKIQEDKVEHDFTTIDLDFTKGSMDGIVKASDTDGLKVSNPGEFLSVEMDSSKYSEICPAIKNDPKTNPVWGYKRYKVSFDYQVDDIPAETSVYLFEIKRDGITGSMNDFIPSYDAIGAWAHGEVELNGVNDNHELSLIISGRYANSIRFKNLKIEEIKEK